MLHLAIEGDEGFEISRLEIERGGTSYTIDTLQAIATQLPDEELFLLMGADSLVDFPHWREPAEICQVATPLVVNRAGQPAPNFEPLAEIVSPKRLAAIKAAQVEMPPVEISSSEIRRLIANSGAWEHLVPEKVAAYIRKHLLYQ
jgi:nicotinate-nucleotide adenylyltransferase